MSVSHDNDMSGVTDGCLPCSVCILQPGILHQEYMSNWEMHNGWLREKSGGTEALLGEGDEEEERMLVYSV